ncbi:nucleoside 2-deoxyribosyltransferase [Haloferax sp. Atlit-19N]|uniref:PfkB family carbohydrate kinase n=1 Tax=Haloferax sp. Atlit-19N TaxID=2077201 RepID=UPI000E280A17|nr:PfkB family carbohydrate kinase [Haloferax sp. Atlit-19N]RDZ43427.1 nucleoside 2-deoxyribosyltransferase [Haloferax sp. Atlit-19N]
MIIAGGAYRELCQFPQDTAFFGSGVRAAAATESIVSSRNQLYTCIGPAYKEALETYAATFNFDVHTTEISETVCFDYLHNHSNPVITPPEAFDFSHKPSAISGDAVLRFGLVEGTAVVSGERVVYDPQSADPVPFDANGSSADELALVLNQHEAAQLTGKVEVRSILDELVAGTPSPDVVVLKRGARGAIVKTPSTTNRIPVYQTDSVWGIGSGDVFTAVFAGEWAENGEDAAEAALTASKATADYCRHRRLPVSKEFVENISDHAPPTFISSDTSPPTIYLAGPFFNIGEQFVVEEVKHLLESEGADVISPVHDIGRAADYDSSEEVAQRDLDAIEQADIVFALLDHLDSGTHFEIGYARKNGTPVIGYTNNFARSGETMIRGSGCEVYEDLSSAIYNTIWRAYA